MLEPIQELKKLDYFAGTWRLEGEVKENPMSPGGKLIETDHNEWMEGGFFLVVRSEFTISNEKKATGVAYLGYDPDKRVYTYDEFNSMGEAIHSRGALDGDTWIWNGERKDGERKTDARMVKTRWVVKIHTTDAYDFKFETSTDGAYWQTIVEGKASKQ